MVPELPFVQLMAVAALGAMFVAVLAMPLGARMGPAAGMLLLRGSLLAVVLIFGGALAWGSKSGDLGRFNAQVGVDAWFQMGLFFVVVYGTGYRLAAAYLADKRKERAKEAADA